MDSPTAIRADRESRQLYLEWSDGEISAIAFRALRCACPCAACVHEFTGERLLDPDSIDPNVAPREMDLAGNYAIRILWSDGHGTGLFTWSQLKQLGRSETENTAR